MANTNKLQQDDWEDVDDWQEVPGDGGGRQPALEKEQGLSGGAFSPTKLVPMIIDAFGGDSNTVGSQAANTVSLGHMPELSGQVRSMGGENYVQARDAVAKKMERDAAANPGSDLMGKGVGTAVLMGAAGSAAPVAAETAMGRIGQAVMMGAGQGALSNPGRTEGVVDPIQAGGRAENAGIGALLGGLFGAGGEALKRGSQAANDVRLIKSGGASDLVKGEIDDALQAVDKTQLAPRDAKLRELIQGNKFEVNPDVVEGTFPNLANRMRSNLPEGAVRRELSPERALRLKRAADSAAQYGQSKPFDPSASAKGEEAKSLADVLRGQLNRVPGVTDLNQEMADIMAKKSALARSSRGAPISAIRAQPGTDKDSLVKAIDKMAGSNLEGLDSRIGNAKDLLLTPSNLVKPLEAMNEARKMGLRGTVEAARVADKAPEGTKEALINAILDAKRKER